jgi:hypothetical protein
MAPTDFSKGSFDEESMNTIGVVELVAACWDEIISCNGRETCKKIDVDHR